MQSFLNSDNLFWMHAAQKLWGTCNNFYSTCTKYFNFYVESSKTVPSYKLWSRKYIQHCLVMCPKCARQQNSGYLSFLELQSEVQLVRGGVTNNCAHDSMRVCMFNATITSLIFIFISSLSLSLVKQFCA